jgi:hypothetical protein
MTAEEYYAAIRALGLRESKVPAVWLDRENDTHSVPHPSEMKPEDRAKVVAKLRKRLTGS